MTLDLADVAVRYGDAPPAITDITLGLGAAETLAVVGPSGSGKSTLLRAVAGLEPLAAGRVLWNEQDLATTPPHRRGFGLMFQDYALFPHRDVAGNVAFGLEMQGTAPREVVRRVAEALELVGLSGFESRPVADLSGGEQQRVALARALAPTPRLLMLDEPLGALDRALRTELLDELGSLFSRLETPIIYVTHDQEEALAIGDRVAVMRDGRLEAVAPPHELWHSPPNEFVARFLGLNNVAQVTVIADTRVSSPWGDLTLASGVPNGSATVLIRPDGILLDEHGPIAGRIVSRSFRGSHTRLTVLVGDASAPLEIHTTGAQVPDAGEHVRLAIPPAAVVLLR